MSEVITGFVKEVTTKQGTSKAGKPWTLFGLVIVSEAGRDLGRFGAGFDAPTSTTGAPVKAQDFVKFEVEATDDGKYFNVKKGTLEVSQRKREAPAAVTAPTSGHTDGVAARTVTQNAIQYQAARNAAIEVVKILGSAKALPITGAATKAGEAKRYDEILDIVDKLTVRFHFDTDTLRVLDRVQDEGEIDAPAVPSQETAAGGDTDQTDFVDDDIPF